MFTVNPSDESHGLDEAIDEIFREMATMPSDSNSYAKMADQLTKLYKLKEIDSPKRVNPDTLFTVAGNLVGILIIIGYEQHHVITSKAMTFLRLR